MKVYAALFLCLVIIMISTGCSVLSGLFGVPEEKLESARVAYAQLQEAYIEAEDVIRGLAATTSEIARLSEIKDESDEILRIFITELNNVRDEQEEVMAGLDKLREAQVDELIISIEEELNDTKAMLAAMKEMSLEYDGILVKFKQYLAKIEMFVSAFEEITEWSPELEAAIDELEKLENNYAKAMSEIESISEFDIESMKKSVAILRNGNTMLAELNNKMDAIINLMRE